VLQCADDVPRPFSDKVRVDVNNRTKVIDFVRALLTDPDFFPRHGQPISGLSPESSEVLEAGEELYDQLQQIVPQESAQPDESWPAFPYMLLGLAMEHETPIRQAIQDGRTAEAHELVRNKCQVIQANSYASQIFNRRSFPDKTNLHALYQIWRQQHADLESGWVDSLCAQIVDAVNWEFPTSNWQLMVDHQQRDLYAPMITHVDRLSSEIHYRFHVHFYRFRLTDDGDRVQVGLPQKSTTQG